MERASLCLCPAGDTPTSRRLYDALAAGCVPVLFEHLDTMAENLPFPNVVDWSAVAVFGGSLQCLAVGYGGDKTKMQAHSAAWLRRVATADPPALACMAARGSAVFAKHLAYETHAFVSTLLVELERRFFEPIHAGADGGSAGVSRKARG
jgi:hypothetical protein